MARDFDGIDDAIDYGSDASIDDFSQITIAAWFVTDNAALSYAIFRKDGAAFKLLRISLADNDVLELSHGFSVTRGDWFGSNGANTAGQRYHGVYTYDNTSVLNNGQAYLDGATDTMTEDSTPVGTATLDAARNASSGDDFFMDGRLQTLCYDNTIWDAASRNRHRWWGVAPGGPSTVKMWHPFYTSDLNNKGTATANGTASGTLMASFATPTVRPGTAMMGMGVGW